MYECNGLATPSRQDATDVFAHAIDAIAEVSTLFRLVSALTASAVNSVVVLIRFSLDCVRRGRAGDISRLCCVL